MYFIYNIILFLPSSLIKCLNYNEFYIFTYYWIKAPILIWQQVVTIVAIILYKNC